ncbi:transketolase family protein [Mycoplasma bradburyae]|uniref:transketolase-like TK C-terminal-containing protein n=1 Tax=Mycoplasma bradburyae TaxID=2963128 RepID=UPI002341439A|nr:transketolase [Mycoplasma bradburyae]MDC4184047.1 transketolase [Mycoplasma bradburyae]
MNIQQQSINTIRVLGIEMINNAKSGHPGIVMSAAPMMYALFHDHLNYDIADLNYVNRDRFILSAGHGSALLYATMYVAGYKSLNSKDLKNFRKFSSKTPGHPESTMLDGVDFGTGPLGQGAATSVGFAMAEANLNARFNNIIDHYTYCLIGDGDMQEGVCQEALAVAGRYQLNKLIWLYDSNDVQLDGRVSNSTNFDVEMLVKSYKWNYILVKDGNDYEAISQAISQAKKSDRPTFIEVKTKLGYASSVEDSNKAHGSPFSGDEIKKIRAKFDYKNKPFTVSSEVKEHFESAINRGKEHSKAFIERLGVASPELREKFISQVEDEKIIFEESWINEFNVDCYDSTRNLFGKFFKKLTEVNDNILVVNCDLSGSTKVVTHNNKRFDINSYDQQLIDVGVREFLAGCIVNGITAHKGLKAVCSTFMAFSDYNKPAIRLGAINSLNSLYVFSHDSFNVGEDGPTHQPIEQLSSLRLIPEVLVYRPANFYELYTALKTAFDKDNNKPIVISTSRSEFNQYKVDPEEFDQGYYYLNKTKSPKLRLIATGSDTDTAMKLAKIFKKEKIEIDVISVPSVKKLKDKLADFDTLQEFKKCKNIVIESGVSNIWFEFVNLVIGVNDFGMSGNPNEVATYFSMDLESLVKSVSTILNLKKVYTQEEIEELIKNAN